MDWALLSWAFVAGAAATINPCGVAMLPAYISYYLGRDDGAQPKGFPDASKGLFAGLFLSAGTLATFTVMGLVIAAVGTAIARFIPWVALLVAVLLLIAGVATLLGRAPSLMIGVGQRAPTSGGPRGFFSFGIGYGFASLGCTLPIFMIVVSAVLSTEFVTGLLAFVAYGLGMGLLLTGISLGVGLGKTAVLRFLRSASPALKYLGGLGLLAAGSYLLYYNLNGLAFILTGSSSNLPEIAGVVAFIVSLVAWFALRGLSPGSRNAQA